MNNEIEIYVKNNIKLINTITVKNSINAELMNNKIQMVYGSTSIDPNDLKTWKYYLNISGEYHFSDTKMFITSLDTLEQIEFNKENLKIHSLTRESYLFGSRYYYTLLNEYPDQEILIKGILYPCDINKAIDAKDGEILSYQEDLVEEQEQTLIWELSEWCKRYQARWRVNAFMYSDTLYPAAQIAIMYLNMVSKLLNLRLKRCRTIEAHSFHIKMYLASHNRLDEFFPYYTLKQKLWLYRNIAYIRHNSGKKSNFNSLIDILLTERGIPLSEFIIKHRDNFVNGYTEYEFYKNHLNLYLNLPDKQNYTLQEIYDKENPLLKENPEYNSYIYKQVNKDISNTPSSTIQTKLLESKILNYNNTEWHPLPDLLLEYWPYMAAIGQYNAVVEIQHPHDSNNLITLTVEEAFIFWLLLSLKRYKFVGLEKIPSWLSVGVISKNKPSVENLLQISITNTYVDYDAKDILDRTPLIRLCRTVPQFNNLVKSIFNEDKRIWYETSNIGDLWKCPSKFNMYLRTREDVWVDFSTSGMDVSEWLNSKNIDIETFNESDVSFLINDIFEKCTGYINDDSTNPGNIQRALIKCLERLSSYSIQIVSDINEENIIPQGWRSVRVNGLESGRNAIIVDEDGEDILQGTVVEKDFTFLDNNRCLGDTAEVTNMFNINIERYVRDVSSEDATISISITLPSMVQSLTIDTYDIIKNYSRCETYFSTDQASAEAGIALS